ncbi:histone methylation protein [Raphidocelis subcapitata]|uniref:Histone-lysine N-methyltransferase, H3 lysine-79 specific n=1 Tax=Raphidocelis subcapitata TaxID=307507 RepID=A0A2V0NQW8_9CHLO|nr:histone methylation protein [Raphidocelis subcapitata]|eukprot:GBF90034.1 histone methylation protein [Raphidocelis subcapitata]
MAHKSLLAPVGRAMRPAQAPRGRNVAARTAELATTTRQQQRGRERQRQELQDVVDADLLCRVADAAQAAQAARAGRGAAAAAAAAATRREQADLLASVYEQLDEEIFFSKGGWKIPPRERALIDAVSAGAAAYGEILPGGIDELLELFDLGPSDTFCDLGSGIGRVVLHAAMQSRVGAAVGLELSDSRLEQAEAAAEVLSGLGVPLRPARFARADLGSCDLEAASGGAGHYFACSTAFGAALCRSLAERLAAAPSFRVLAASRALPPQRALIKVGELGGIPYSWIPSGSLHVYVRDWQSAPAAVLARFWCAGGACWAPPRAAARGAPLLRGLAAGEEPLVLGPGAAAAGGSWMPAPRFEEEKEAGGLPPPSNPPQH